jgi:hypothetical protein
MSCEAGRLFVRIMPDGDVYRCGKDKLGNILEHTFEQQSRPSACDTSYCYYFCKKYVLPNRPWLSRQLDAWHHTVDRKLAHQRDNFSR